MRTSATTTALTRQSPPRRPLFFFFFNDTATTEIYTLSLHDALPISMPPSGGICNSTPATTTCRSSPRSEEHTSELQSHVNLVCRLLLEKKKSHNAGGLWGYCVSGQRAIQIGAMRS